MEHDRHSDVLSCTERSFDLVISRSFRVFAQTAPYLSGDFSLWASPFLLTVDLFNFFSVCVRYTKNILRFSG